MSLDPVALLQRLIRCPSVTPIDAGVMDVVAEALTVQGFAVERLRFEGNGSYPVDNLFATRGSGGPHLLFAGHTDVVPAGDESAWHHPPFAAEIEDGILYGRGAADMKSGVAAFIAAASRLPADHPGTLSLAITNDEEADSVNGTEPLIDWAIARGHRFDLAIVGEPSARVSAGDSVKIGRRGSLNGRIRVTGAQGHSAYPERAINPLPVAAALVLKLSSTPLDAGSAHFPPSTLAVTAVETGNPASNVIPGAVTIAFNIRFNEQWDPQSLDAWIGERIEEVAPHGCTIAYAQAGRPAISFLSPLDGAADRLLAAIERKTGARPELATWGGTSDARFIARHCPAIELGIPGPTLHKTDEHIALADLEALTALYAYVSADFLAGPAR
jgi:succinyl-diaminopimelate desuccinylase